MSWLIKCLEIYRPWVSAAVHAEADFVICDLEFASQPSLHYSSTSTLRNYLALTAGSMYDFLGVIDLQIFGVKSTIWPWLI